MSSVKKLIEISIVDFYLEEDSIKDYTLYKLKGFDSEGDIEVTRRYSDFVMIRKLLVAKWPGCCIPVLPPKSAFKNIEMEFLKQRRIGLDQFLRKVAEMPYLHHSKEYQIFLRYTQNNLAEKLKAHREVFFEEIIHRYTNTFRVLNDLSQARDAQVNIGNFKSFLQKAYKKLARLAPMMREIVRAKKNFYQDMVKFQTQVASEYEDKMIGELENFKGKKDIFASNPELDEKVNKIKANASSLEVLEEWMNMERKQIESLFESIKQKDQLEKFKIRMNSKQSAISRDLEGIASGKFSLKNLSSWKVLVNVTTKEAAINKLNQKLMECKNHIKNISTLIDMVAILISANEIERLQNKTSGMFYQLINIVAQNEVGNIANVIQYWEYIINKNSANPETEKEIEKEKAKEGYAAFI